MKRKAICILCRKVHGKGVRVCPRSFEARARRHSERVYQYLKRAQTARTKGPNFVSEKTALLYNKARQNLPRYSGRICRTDHTSDDAFVLAPERIVISRTLTPTDKLVGIAIIDLLRLSNGSVSEACSDIAAFVNVSERAVRAAVKKLTDDGWIEAIRFQCRKLVLTPGPLLQACRPIMKAVANTSIPQSGTCPKCSAARVLNRNGICRSCQTFENKKSAYRDVIEHNPGIDPAVAYVMTKAGRRTEQRAFTAAASEASILPHEDIA